MKFFLFTCLVALLFSCKEPTADNSVYKNDIIKLDSNFNALDSSFSFYQTIDKEQLHIIAKKGAEKFKESRAKYVTDTLIIPFDYALAVYKGNFVKGLKNIKRTEAQIEKDFSYNKTQYKAFRENLIHETLKTDTAALFLTQEIDGYNKLNEKIKKYNSKAINALNLYDSLTIELDSIVNLYGSKK